MEQTREEIAVHEAGHCIAAVLLLRIPERVSIVPDNSTGGRTFGLTEWLHFVRVSADRGETDTAKRLADCQAFVCAAGQVAVEAVFGIGNDPTRHGIDDDIAMEALEIAYGSYEAMYRYMEILGDAGLIFADADVIAAVQLAAQELLMRREVDDCDSVWRKIIKLLKRSRRHTYADMVQLFKRRERARIRKNGLRSG